MKTARVLLVLFLLVALIPAGGASAQAIPLAPDPICASLNNPPYLNAFTAVHEGSVVCLLVPGNWNGDLVIFAHGYVSPLQPVGIPWDQLISNATGVNLPQMVLGLGYAFATTSYDKTGLAIKTGVDDVVELVEYAQAVAAGFGASINRVYLTGASEGGAVTTLALEKYPDVFDAGLSTCGPIGSFESLVQYWGNFRVAFDQTFPNIALTNYGATPIYIPPQVLAAWDSQFVQQMAAYFYSSPAEQAKLLALLTEMKVPFDPADPLTVLASTAELLWYNVNATNDGRLTLVPQLTEADLLPPSLKGNPYSNLSYTAGYPDGIKADKAALREIRRNYTTSGDLDVPMVLMHTTGDPVIPFSQSTMYLSKALKAGSLSKVSYFPVVRYGHCNFQEAELLLGFYIMVLRATYIPFSTDQVAAALPDPAQREVFEQLKKEHNK